MEHSVDGVKMYSLLLEYPWWYHRLPLNLEETCGLMDRRWLFEFIGNSYLHFRVEAYCGMSYTEIFYRAMLEHAVDQTEDPTSLIYVQTIEAVDATTAFIKDYEYDILQYFERLGIPDRVCDYTHIVSNTSPYVVQWNFFIPPF